MSPTHDAKGREYDERPWGNYLVLDDDEADHKVKRIEVTPGKRLSYQSHAKRSEHWFVVSGTAKDLRSGVALCAETIKSGAAKHALGFVAQNFVSGIQLGKA